MTTTLVVGASGATGQLLVRQLLEKGQVVRAIVRSADRIPEDIRGHGNLTIIEATVLDIDDGEMANHVQGCDAVASCLGHNLSFRGMFLPPRKLVRDATRKLCNAIEANKPAAPVRFVLMNTSGNSNRDIPERVSVGQQIVVGLIRALVPPHSDNEKAADYLRTTVGQNSDHIGWVAVRPDGLVDEPEPTPYEAFPSPIRSAIFDPGKTSRINVASFMATLITDDEAWNKWKGQMPVLYNQTSVP